MKIFIFFIVVLAIMSSSLAKKRRAVQENSENQSLVETCRELNGGGTKVRLEFDLGGACRGPCKLKKKRKSKKTSETPVEQLPEGGL